MEEKKQSIQIVIADRNYRFSINPSEEEIMRIAVKKISERLENYKTQFQLQDNQDALAITALQFVVQLINDKKNDTSAHLLKVIQSLDSQIGDYIEQNFK